ncbi:MAG: SDR family NAD(P)-dependent oxidoreductase, partial [Candidatus Marinimicrobia bacterium]|nr:SDR family NAD(P)-dependent oxidoreductase [Candidatus Neomarinimicrobiota bacterium]
PHMRSQRSGYILNISSLAGSLGVPLQGYYSASKHAVDGFTKSLRMEVRKFGIKVVLLKPGFVKTNLHHSFQKAEQSIQDYEEITHSVEQALNESITEGIDPSVISEKVLKILRLENPKQSYAVGTDGKLLPILNRLFPRIFEYGSRKKFNLD